MIIEQNNEQNDEQTNNITFSNYLYTGSAYSPPDYLVTDNCTLNSYVVDEVNLSEGDITATGGSAKAFDRFTKARK